MIRCFFPLKYTNFLKKMPKLKNIFGKKNHHEFHVKWNRKHKTFSVLCLPKLLHCWRPLHDRKVRNCSHMIIEPFFFEDNFFKLFLLIEKKRDVLNRFLYTSKNYYTYRYTCLWAHKQMIQRTSNKTFQYTVWYFLINKRKLSLTSHTKCEVKRGRNWKSV